MNRKILLLFTTLCIGYFLSAQSVSTSVVATGGAESQTDGIIIEWTLGELAIDYLEADSMHLSEGFHQPTLTVFEKADDLTINTAEAAAALTDGYQIEVWPSPVYNQLNIKVLSESDEALSIELLDAMGRKVVSNSKQLSNGIVEMDFSDKTAGVYLLRFLKEDGTLVKTILNIKH